MNALQKLQSDLMLLERINRNMLSLHDAAAYRFARLIRMKILRTYNATSSDECTEILRAELRKFD